jgi:Xaa-Pro aminopeptidase
VLDGYCSDCTRTYATGDGVPDDAREVYEVVRAAQLAGLDAVVPGPNGREVDSAARVVIDVAGYGDHFGHGLGHGVGIEIHEAPRLSQLAPEDPLEAGMIVTVEPGVPARSVWGADRGPGGGCGRRAGDFDGAGKELSLSSKRPQLTQGTTTDRRP